VGRPADRQCLGGLVWACLGVRLGRGLPGRSSAHGSAPPPPAAPPSAPPPVLAAATLAATLARAAAPRLDPPSHLRPRRRDRHAVARPLGRGCPRGLVPPCGGDVRGQRGSGRRRRGGRWREHAHAERADEGGGAGGEGAPRGEGGRGEGARREPRRRAAGRVVGGGDESGGERARRRVRRVRRRGAEGKVREEGEVIRGEAGGGQAVLEADRVLSRQL